ncbi:MAG: Mut7-C RNAse domain-containing protein [Candidatus Omnitrophota bacterium]|jgi:uncharacterized protein with PIN domain
MRFILTPELGRLAKWLRILGFDAAYSSQTNFSCLLVEALRDNRIIITRNSRFVHKARVTRLVHVKSDSAQEQLKQVFKELSIRPDEETMFSRCIICNTELSEIDKSKVKDKVPEYVFNTQDNFLICPCCCRIYWQGTHWGNISKTLREIDNGIYR